ncbi:MAG TPA: hypothetical protein PLF37_14990, partial [Planctomycetota bacterium]|nr:hypothetical protein [Planctomycetota bacterium]
SLCKQTAAWIDDLAACYGWSEPSKEAYFQPESVLFALFSSDAIRDLFQDIPERLHKENPGFLRPGIERIVGMAPGSLTALHQMSSEELLADRRSVDEWRQENKLPQWSVSDHELGENQEQFSVWRSIAVRQWTKAQDLLNWIRERLTATRTLHRMANLVAPIQRPLKASAWKECKVILGDVAPEVTVTLTRGGRRETVGIRMALRFALEQLALPDPTLFGKGNRGTARGMARDLRWWLRQVFDGPRDDPLATDPMDRGYTANFKVVREV